MKKCFLLLMAMFAGVLLTTELKAQSDGFFKGSYETYDNRAAEIGINDDGNIGNWGIGQTVPLGEGLLLLGNYKKYDWGVYCSYTGASPYKITNGGNYSWRLLTVSEQSFILGPNTNPRPGGNCRRSSTVNGVPNARFIKACLTDASNGSGLGLYGLIIFPDTYIHPSSDLAPLPQKINDPNSNFTDNNYTIAQWTEMEKAKAVFLPAAGCRWGSDGSTPGVKYYKIQDINKHCYYWSSSDDISNPSTHAKNMRIGTSDFVSNSYTQRVRGNCVRLVRIATSADE